MTITITSPFTTWLAERWTAFWASYHEPEGYAFRLDLEEDTLRYFRFLYLAYLRRNPHRYTGGGLTDIPEFGLLLNDRPREELNAFTCYVIARLAQPRDRFDFQRYAVDHRLLEQLLLLRPWANEDGILRIGEALFFMSPFGYEGVLYWPLTAYLRAVNASYGGRPVGAGVGRVLDMMAGELRQYFAFGYATEVVDCQLLLQGLLRPVPGEEKETLVRDLPAHSVRAAARG